MQAHSRGAKQHLIFKILYRVSEILKNRGSPFWKFDFFSNSLFALDWKCE